MLAAALTRRLVLSVRWCWAGCVQCKREEAEAAALHSYCLDAHIHIPDATLTQVNAEREVVLDRVRVQREREEAEAAAAQEREAVEAKAAAEAAAAAETARLQAEAAQAAAVGGEGASVDDTVSHRDAASPKVRVHVHHPHKPI